MQIVHPNLTLTNKGEAIRELTVVFAQRTNLGSCEHHTGFVRLQDLVIMEELKRADGSLGDYICAATVQEEIGSRGANTSAFSIKPDVAIALDVTHATDYPGIDTDKYGSVSCGKGPVIARGPNINPVVFERLCAAAEAEGIRVQFEAEPSDSGTDASEMQIQRGGCATGLVSIPLRYMHTPTEVIKLSDIEDTVTLLKRFILDLDEDVSFVPGM